MIKAIIWDLDGTLIKFKVNSLKARRKAIQILKNSGVPKDKLSKDKSILENVKISREYLSINDFSDEIISGVLKQVNQAVIDIEHEAALKAELTDGIINVLNFAKINGLQQAIFTYNTYENALVSLRKVKIEHYFDIIAGRDTVTNLKPHPDHLNYICNKLNARNKEIVVIGDTDRDIESAINIGAYSIALNTKLPSFLKRGTFQKANKIIEPEEIPDLLIEVIENLL